jgi:UDP:flavonoid glycosyltransferase YjiC (YdhE family)
LPKQKKILVAALDWGMGHATRLVPLIRSFQKNGDEVILASAGKSYDFFKSYFPELLILQKPAYNIRYSEKYSLLFAIILQIPKIMLAIIREHIWLKKTDNMG